MHGHRVEKSKFTDELIAMMKDLVILPGNSQEVDMLIYAEHVRNGHSSREHTIASLRQQVWIVGIRRVVKRVLWKCKHCKTMRSKPAREREAPLPLERFLSRY